MLPILSKAGCNAGSCHAKAEGQNGFKLTIFAYDPRADYLSIIKGARGRRVHRQKLAGRPQIIAMPPLTWMVWPVM